VIKLYSPEQLNLLVTMGLVVLIWIVQIIHYPSFLYYSKEDFSEGMISHQRSISFITLPLMMTELFLTCFIFYKTPNIYSSLGMSLVILIWLSTFYIQVPLHKKLLTGKDLTLIEKLIRTNWIRTIMWTLKLLLLLIFPYL
jgi:hypothetical protein